MVDQILTYGYGIQDMIITGGYNTRGYGILERILADMEKKSIGYTLIDYRYCEPGLADHTPLDDNLGRLE